MPRRHRDLLADAHQATRDVRNELERQRSATFPLQAEIARLKTENGAIERKLVEAIEARRVTKRALDALVEYLHTVLATGKTGE